MKFPWSKTKDQKTQKEPETITLELEGSKVFRWGDYKFCFPYKGEKLYEFIANVPEPLIKCFPPCPMLRVGTVLTDLESQDWMVKTIEPIFLNPCYLKGINRFEPPKGQYSPYGWKIFQYGIEKV